MIRLVTVMVMASFMLGCGTFWSNRTIVEPAMAKSSLSEETTPPSQRRIDRVIALAKWLTEQESPSVEMDGHVATAAGASSLSVTIEKEDASTEEGQKKETEASATGLGISTTSSELVGTMEFTPPTATTNGAHSDAGGMTFDIQKMSSGGSMYILFGLGGVCVIGGLVILVLVKQVKLGLIVSAGGFALIFTGKLLETYPWAVLVAFGVILVIGVLFVYNALVGKKKDIALNAVVRAVEKSPDGGKSVKEKVGQESGKNKELVKDVITKVKREEGLAT